MCMRQTIKRMGLVGVATLLFAFANAQANGERSDSVPVQNNETTDTLVTATNDSINVEKNVVVAPRALKKRQQRDWATWHPEPKRALWLALVLPGAGQVYNRKFWKLPIVYGGFVGCIYAMTWNNQMYHDYSQAYMDIMDNDPNTQSYNQFLHLGNKITAENEERYKSLFQRRKDYYRRYRDLSLFCIIGVYALSVIDAYVDASLSQFDISKDLSMKVSPQVIKDNSNYLARNSLRSTALGVQCSFTF